MTAVSDLSAIKPARPGLLAEIAAEFPAASAVIREGGAVAVNQAALRGDPALVRRAIEALPNTSALFPVREAYLKPGYSLKAALGDTPEAFDLFLAWCLKWEGNENGPNTFESVEADWRRMKGPYKIGARWLAEISHRHSGGAFDIGELWFEPQHESLFPVEAAGAPARTYSFLSLNEAAATALTTSARPLIKGLLDQEALSIIYGPPNHGKSFALFDMAYHVAAGRPWAGRRVAQGIVVMIVGEGSGGVRKRAAALVRRYGPCDAFHMLTTHVDLYDPNADVRPLAAAIAQLGNVIWIGVDTVAQAMGSGDENNARDMGMFAQNLSLLRAIVRAHVTGVHHTGKDVTRGARGSNALLGAIDTEIEVMDGLITDTKQRDLEKGFRARFTLAVVELGKDGDGEPITSATIDLEQDAPAHAAPATGVELVVLQALDTAEAALPRGAGAPIDRVVDAVAAAGETMTKGSVRHHLRTLFDKGRIKKTGRGCWTVVRRGGDWFEPPAGGVFD